VNWIGGSGTDWNTPGNWSDTSNGSHHVPTVNDDAVITSAAVTHSSLNSPVNSLTLTSSTLTLSGGSAMTSSTQGTGSTIVLQGGTLAGPSATQDVDHVGSGVYIQCTSSGGTLSGLIADGTIDVTAAGARFNLVNGMTLNGTILVGDNSSTPTAGQVFFSHSPGDFPENIGGPGSIVFGGSTNNLLSIATANTTVEFETDTKILGKSGQILTQFASSTYLNAGTINANTAGGNWLVDLGNGTAGTNQGTIEVTASGSSLSTGGTWTNSGALVASGGTLNLGGGFSLASGTTLNTAGGTVNLTGTLNNGGQTLALDGSNTGSWNLLGGAISGGTVSTASPARLVGTPSGGTLSGVTLVGTLDLALNNGAVVNVINGLTLNGAIDVGNAAGTTAGTVLFQSTETIAVAAGGSGQIVFGGSAGNALLLPDFTAYRVTFGPGLLVHGKSGTIASQFEAVSLAYLNQGTIAADVAGGAILVHMGGADTGSNSGTLEALNGGSLTLTGAWTNTGTALAQSGGTLSASTPTNYSGGTLTGGTWQVLANSTLRVAMSAGIATNAANILLDGTGAHFYSDSGTTDALAAPFALNAATGSIAVADGYNFTTAGNTTTGGNFENDGTLTVGASSTFTVAGNLANYDGVSTLTGGTYLLTGTFQFTGANVQTNAATIVLNGPAAHITDLSGNDALGPNLALNAAGASLTVQNGYNFTTAGAFENDGTLTVGNNSTFTVSGNDTDTGTLNVLAGGTLSLPSGGTASGAVSVAGTLIVGAGATFTDSGSYGQTGTLLVQAGATATLSGAFSNFAGGTLSGGTYDLLGTLQFANAVVTTNAANLILDGSGAGITDLSGNDALGPNLALNAVGGHLTVLDGYSFTTAGNFENDGTLTIGVGSAFNVSGNFTQGAAATLVIQLGGTSAGQFGQLTVSGTATLAGTLSVTLVNGYVPTTGDTIPVLTYGSRSGDFTTGPVGFNRSYDDVDGILNLVAQ
jgi:hypothetical protein